MMASDLSVEMDWRSLHPASVVVNLLPHGMRVLRGAWPLLLALVYGGKDGSDWLNLFIVLFLFWRTVGATLIHFLTLRYRVADGRLEIKTGWLNRQIRVIDPERIQNTEMIRTIPHKLTGLVEVRIETASGTDVEGLLSALTVEDAQQLISRLSAARQQRRSVQAPPPSVKRVIENDAWDLLKFGATATQFGGLALFLSVTWFQGMDIVFDVPTSPQQWTPLVLVLGGIGVCSAAWIFGIALGFLRYHRFELSVEEEALVASQGLFTRRNVRLPLQKVQIVTVSEPLLRRVLGFCSIRIETAAARLGESGVESVATLIPVVEREQIDAIVELALSETAFNWAAMALDPPHRLALARELGWATLRSLVLVSVASWFFGWYGLLSLLYLPLALAMALYDFRFQGWWIGPSLVIARRGFWNRRTWIIPRSKLQSLEVVRGPLQRGLGLGFLRLRVAGSSVLLPELSTERALHGLKQLSQTGPRLDLKARGLDGHVVGVTDCKDGLDGAVRSVDDLEPVQAEHVDDVD